MLSLQMLVAEKNVRFTLAHSCFDGEETRFIRHREPSYDGLNPSVCGNDKLNFIKALAIMGL